MSEYFLKNLISPEFLGLKSYIMLSLLILETNWKGKERKDMG